MNKLGESVLESYFRSHKELIDAEEVNDSSVVVSFPLYYSSNHRVEISVTRLPSGDFQLSDMAKTIDELKFAGVPISGQTKKRIVSLAANANVRFVGNTMIRDCTAEQLGDVLHLFADSAKTVGDKIVRQRLR